MRAAWLLTPLALLLAAGCNPLLPDPKGHDTGYRLILTQPVTIPPDHTRVYFQNGRVTGTTFDSYQPSCSLEVRDLADQPQRVAPDTFIVHHIQHFFEEVAAIRWRRQQLAGLALAGADVDASPSDIFEGWHFWLYSERQPRVLRLTCRGIFAEPWEARPPTHEEISAALGAVARLIKPGLKPGRF